MIWLSNWNGYEVGCPNIDVVSLYINENNDKFMYIDLDSGKILETWTENDDE